jgi:molybdenum cofactor synthesis domain-containing protein
MEVALLTVGDELLDGDTVNTNGNWLAAQLTDRGVTVTRIVSLPDERGAIATHVREYDEAFDAVVVTGGIGSTPDDVTIEAVADAFDRDLTVQAAALEAVEQRLAELQRRLPEVDADIDAEAEARLPARSRVLVNETGLAPGCVLGTVYVLPGIPSELRGMFDSVAEEFTGDRRSRYLYTVEPESNVVPALEEAMERFDVTIGCYPDREEGHNRLKLTGTDDQELSLAGDWLLEAVDASERPVSRDWDPEPERTD